VNPTSPLIPTPEEQRSAANKLKACGDDTKDGSGKKMLKRKNSEHAKDVSPNAPLNPTPDGQYNAVNKMDFQKDIGGASNMPEFVRGVQTGLKIATRVMASEVRTV
jgi:hypothetical protein